MEKKKMIFKNLIVWIMSIRETMILKKIIKGILSIGVLIVMIGITIIGASSFSIDDDDTIVASKGELVESSFIIVDYPEGKIELNSDFEWLSLREDRYLSSSEISSEYIIKDQGIFVPYFVKIPENADIGIYRTFIEVTSGDEVEILNIKISVQNKFMKGVYKFFNSTTTKIYLSIIFIVGIITSIIIYRRSVKR